MARHVLAKLARPRLYDSLPRDRLFRRLDESSKQPLTWICALPGAGKTTLVASYLESRKLPSLWYQLDSGDADPATFIRYLVELAEQLGSRKRVSLPYLTPEYLSDIPGFARRFFRSMFARLPENGTLVLDNCQEVASATFHQILAEAVNEAPASVRIIAISRSRPPAELARLRANHQVAELNWDDLRMTPSESSEILLRRGITDPARIAEVQNASDGWAAGLMLLTNFDRSRTSPLNIELDEKEVLFDYFAGQVLDSMPRAQREMLIKTAVLPQVTPHQAASLSGDPNADVVLDDLYRRQYFVDRRSEPEISYRYHDLFREFLLNRAESEFDASALETLRSQAGRLLLKGNNAEYGIELLCSGNHLQEAEIAIDSRAPSLLGEGRWKTLLKLIALIPDAQIAISANLTYWRGMAHIAFDPVIARGDLQTSLELARETNDFLGQLKATVGIVLSTFVQGSSLTNLVPWIDPMAQLLMRIEEWPDDAVELEARSMFLLAASHVRPQHNFLGTTALRVLELISKSHINSNTRTASGLRALVYFMWRGDAAQVRRVNEQLDKLLPASGALPVHIAMGYAFRGLYEHFTLADSAAALRSVARALEVTTEHGLAHTECLALEFQGIITASQGRDPEQAKEALRRVAEHGLEGNFNRTTLYHLAQAHIHKWRGDTAQALQHAHLCTEAARGNCPLFLLIVGSNLVNVYADAGEYGRAQSLLDECYALARETVFDNFGAALELEEAYLALHQGNHDLCHLRLRHALGLAQTNPRHAATLHYMCGSIPVLFAEALRSGIEMDYVSELVKRWDVPAPRNAPLDWPWPLSVRTLGKFEVKVNGKPIDFGRKAPRKALALLKALIAFGGTNVPERALTDALWPDAEGDAAHSAYTMTLKRLRALLGDANLLQQRASMLSLDRRKCWVDAWAFEDCIGQADRVPAALELYGGGFLIGDDDAAWAAAPRDRLRSRFVGLVTDAGHEMEQAGRHEEAVRLYRRGLDADDLAEAFYQGLMRCQSATGRTADAVATYQQLKHLLSTTYGVKPSSQTERLYQSLHDL